MSSMVCVSILFLSLLPVCVHVYSDTWLHGGQRSVLDVFITLYLTLADPEAAAYWIGLVG